MVPRRPSHVPAGTDNSAEPRAPGRDNRPRRAPGASLPTVIHQPGGSSWKLTSTVNSPDSAGRHCRRALYPKRSQHGSFFCAGGLAREDNAPPRPWWGGRGAGGDRHEATTGNDRGARRAAGHVRRSSDGFPGPRRPGPQMAAPGGPALDRKKLASPARATGPQPSPRPHPQDPRLHTGSSKTRRIGQYSVAKKISGIDHPCITRPESAGRRTGPHRM